MMYENVPILFEMYTNSANNRGWLVSPVNPDVIIPVARELYHRKGTWYKIASFAEDFNW